MESGAQFGTCNKGCRRGGAGGTTPSQARPTADTLAVVGGVLSAVGVGINWAVRIGNGETPTIATVVLVVGVVFLAVGMYFRWRAKQS